MTYLSQALKHILTLAAIVLTVSIFLCAHFIFDFAMRSCLCTSTSYTSQHLALSQSWAHLATCVNVSSSNSLCFLFLSRSISVISTVSFSVVEQYYFLPFCFIYYPFISSLVVPTTPAIHQWATFYFCITTFSFFLRFNFPLQCLPAATNMYTF